MKQFYTYIHCKPNGDPFYVGKGIYSRCYDFGKRNAWHKNIVAKHGKENIQVLIFKKDSEESAFKSEIRFIQMLRNAGFELCNMTNGGEGISGFKHNDLTKIKCSVAAIGNKNSVGRRSNLVSKKLSNYRKGIKKVGKSYDHILNLIKNNTGKKRSKETCEKISNGLIGNKNSLGKNKV